MPTIIWNRTDRDVVHNGAKTLVFSTSGDADVWLSRQAVKNRDSKATPEGGGAKVYDKLTVT